jgi:hypothetical protein
MVELDGLELKRELLFFFRVQIQELLFFFDDEGRFDPSDVDHRDLIVEQPSSPIHDIAVIL